MRRATRSTSFMVAVLLSASCAATSPVPAELQLGHESPVVSEGWVDSLNRYLSTVVVTTTFFVPKQGTKVKTCTGVLIHPRAVLTAGHCVCDVRKPVPPEASDSTITDRSTCAKTTQVTLLRYTPGADSSIPQATNLGPFTGTVQAHENLQIVYKELQTSSGWETSTEYSRADLALILLSDSLSGMAQPVKLAEGPVHIKDRVILVGYGSAFLGGAMDLPVRRYGENTVASIKDDGSTFHVGTPLEIAPSYGGEKPGVLRARGSYATAGDSGGPCLRERQGVLELVGIARSTHGPPLVLSVYTSTHAYLGWLRQQLARLGGDDTD